MDKLILLVGVITYDLVGIVEEYPAEDSKVRTKKSFHAIGGNVYNSQCCLRKLGMNAVVVSVVGDDLYGNWILEEAKGNGGAEMIFQHQDSTTAFTYVLVNQKNNTRTCVHTPASCTLTEEDMDHMRQFVGPNMVSLVILDARTPDVALETAKWAQEKCVPVLVDCEKVRENIDVILIEYTTVAVCNEHFPVLFTKQENKLAALSQILESSKVMKFIIMTLGKQGAIFMCREEVDMSKHTVSTLSDVVNPTLTSTVYISQSKITYSVYYCAGFAVDAVDTNGAGDVFVGAVAFAFVQGFTPEETLLFANYIAAQKCSGFGMESVPSYKQLLNLKITQGSHHFQLTPKHFDEGDTHKGSG